MYMDLLKDFMIYWRNRKSPEAEKYLINIVKNFLENNAKKLKGQSTIIDIMKIVIDFIIQFDPT